MVGWAALTKSYDDWGPILMSWRCVCLPVGVPPHPRNLLRVFFLLDWHSSAKVWDENSLFLRKIEKFGIFVKNFTRKNVYSISSLRILTFMLFFIIILWFGMASPTYFCNFKANIREKYVLCWHLTRNVMVILRSEFFGFLNFSSCRYFVARKLKHSRYRSLTVWILFVWPNPARETVL
jgi:hypothetical protein